MHQESTGERTSGTARSRTPWLKVDGPPLGHITAFDGIRGFFIPLVVMYHAQLIDRVFPGGMVVIDFFFVVSGFLITTLLLDEMNENSDISLQSFYTRRMLRLFPAMYLMILLFVVLMGAVQLFSPDSFDDGYWWGLEALGAATYSYNILAAIFPQHMGGLIGHTWSLSVEEQFYFVWPLLLAFVLRRMLRRSARSGPDGRRVNTDRKLVLGAIGFVVTCFAIRFAFQDVVSIQGHHVTWTDNDDPTWQGILYRLAASRPDMVVLGCLVAVGARHIPRPVPEVVQRWLRVVAFGFWILFAMAMTMSGRLWGFDRYGDPFYQLAMLGLGVMTLDLFLRTDSIKSRFFSHRPLRKVGLRTYGIYLWHVPALWIFLPMLAASHGLQKMAIGIVATAAGIGAGFLSFRYIEKPFLKMKMTRFQRVSNKKDDTGDAPEAIDLRTDTTDATAPDPGADADPPVGDAPASPSRARNTGDRGPQGRGG